VTGAQEAVYALEELADKHGASGRVLVSIAVAYMHLAEKTGAPSTASGSTNGLYEEAEAKLQQALIKVPQDPDALANLIVVSQHLGRAPEVVSRYLSQLRLSDAHHPLIQGLTNFENAFDRVAIAINV
jgi:coatomer protein complex subunit epsilon